MPDRELGWYAWPLAIALAVLTGVACSQMPAWGLW